MERRPDGHQIRVDVLYGPGRVRLDRVHGAGRAAYAATVRGFASLRAWHAGHPEGVQDGRGAGLQATSGAEYRARRALAAATLRQEFYADGDDDPQAGADSVLLAEPGRLQAINGDLNNWSVGAPLLGAAAVCQIARVRQAPPDPSEKSGNA